MTGSTSDRPTGQTRGALPVLLVRRAQQVTQALTSGPPAISADGRYVAFVSESGDLVEGDDNGAADVFLRDTALNRTVLVSRSRFGGSAAGSSLQPSLSADGQVVAFTSSAPDLVPGDWNGTLDVFVHDVRTGEIELVSRGSTGELANRDSFSPSLSADGRFVAFSTHADNLDPRDTNQSPDVYLHDRVTHRTTLISTSSEGHVGDGASGQPSVSGDGRLVAFTSVASNLHPDDTNAVADVFLHDTASGTTELVSRNLDGKAADGISSEPAISADGRAVVFTSSAADIARDDDNGADDVFAHRVDTGLTDLVSAGLDGSPAAGASHSGSISADGARVAYLSDATDLVAGHATDGSGQHRNSAYVRDLEQGGTALAAFATGRVPGDGDSTAVVVSASGSHVAFSDTSSDLAGHPRPAPGEEHTYVARLSTAAVPEQALPSDDPAS